MKTRFLSYSCVVLGFFLSLLILIVQPLTALALEPPIINGNQQMSAEGQQVLSVMNYQTGQTYTWSIESGGGSLSATTGEKVTYTAPDSNPDGENNPTIKVRVENEICDTFKVAINAYDMCTPAYTVCKNFEVFPGPHGTNNCQVDYDCNGKLCATSCGCTRTYPNNQCSCIESGCDLSHCCRYSGGTCSSYELSEGISDVRTEYMKTHGCSPAALLPGYEPEPSIPEDVDLGIDDECEEGWVSDPISIYNGNNNEIGEDLRFASPNRRPFIFKRFYNSRSEQTGSLGYGWTHSCNVSLNPLYEFEGNVYLKIVDETGRGVYFENASSDHYAGAFKEKTTVEVEEGNYIWYRLDGRRFVFNSSGQLIRIEDEVGNCRNLAYDVNNRLQTVTDVVSSRVLTFHYNDNDRVTHITGPVTTAVPDGIWVSYGYDSNQNLTSVTYADGSGFDYSYTDSLDVHNLTEKKDKMGHFLASWNYDDQDRAIENVSRDGCGATINYVNENKVEVTDAYGIIRTYTIWDIDGRDKVTDIGDTMGCPTCGAGVKRLEYDSAAHVIELEYANGLINQYDDFDSRGNAGTVKMAVTTPDEKMITYTFHPEIDAKLNQTEASVLGGGNDVTIWDYDNDGNATPNENPTRLLSRKIERGFTRDTSGNVIPYEYITTYTYNGKGQVLTVDGPHPGIQDVTTFTYDATTGNLLSVTRPLIGTTTHSDYDAAGRVGRVTDPNGNALTYTYDGKGRIKTIRNEADGSTTTYDYNNAGKPSNVTGPNGATSVFTYDGTYGRLTRTTDSLGNYIHYSYDEQGNRTELSHFNPSNEHLYWKRFDYQGTTKPGKLWRVINPDNTYTEYTYNAGGNVHSVKDPAGKMIVNEYDGFNRLTAVTQPGNIVTGYAYDSHGNLVTLTDSENHSTSYVYDDLRRLVSTTSPDTNITSYAYDPAGNLVSKTDAGGNTISYTYDAANRLTRIHFPDSTQDITYTHDQGANGNGCLTGTTDPSGSYTYAYDTKGNLITEEKIIDGVTYTTHYTHDPAGVLTGITYPNGRTVTCELDGSGKVIKVTTTKDGATRTLAENISYLPFGPVKSLAYGNGTALTKTYDRLYRLTGMGAGSLQSFGYSLDPAGNITAITDNLDAAKTQVFTYDDLYRLTAATGVYGDIGYTYDNIGNRLTRTENGQTDTYTYETGTNRLNQITGTNPQSFTHDANGNTTAIDSRSFAYNRNSRLMKVSENSATIGTYTYNGNGQRIKKTAGDTTTVYHYDRFGNLIGESTPAGDFLAEYFYLGSTRLAVIAGETAHEIAVHLTTNKGRNLSGVRVYAFTESGSYTGEYATSDENGIAHFELSDFSEGSYKFRADYLSYRFWSDVITLPGTYSTNIQIEEETTTILVTQGGGPKEGVKVYLFNANGSYLGLYETTDSNGTVTFDLPVGKDFKFRTDILGSQFFSETITVVSGGTNSYGIASGGGVLSVTIDRGEGIPIDGINVYLFSTQGSYLGLGFQADDQGHVSFDVPSGDYKVRTDYLGYQFWSQEITVSSDKEYILSIPHQDVTITVNGDYNGDVEQRENLKVYLFNSSGSYLGQYQDTNNQGKVTFSLPEKDYKVRVDYLSGQYWSNAFTWTDETVTMEEGATKVTVANMGQPLEGINVYVFNNSGSYLGLYDVTDDEGKTSFRLPAGDYNFRADYMGNHYWSGTSTVIAHVENPLTISTGGGSFTLTFQRGDNNPLEGMNCYLFSESGYYLGEYSVTNDQGEASFNLADGTYKIRIDYLGYQFWTDAFSIPGASDMTYTISHQDVTVTVEGNYDDNIESKANLKVYLFTPGGSYLSQYRTTGDQGQVTFNLPQKDYKVRADYMGNQYWSNVFNWTGETITINEGMAEVHMLQGFTPLENVNVYVFTSGGSYLGVYDKTDADGIVIFRLPEGTYKFRGDYQGNQYWATEPVNADQVNIVNINTGGGIFTLTVEKEVGVPITGIPVYVFTSEGSYLGLTQQTDDQGQVTFDLSDGDYKFRADYLGYLFWTGVSTVPTTLSDVLMIVHQDVTITVNKIYGYDTEPLENIKVYLFSSSGSYLGQYQNTNDQGQVTFNLPEEDYKVRADYLSGQYWSDTFNQEDAVVDIDHGVVNLHVTFNGQDVEDAPVYIFSESGSYLGRYERTGQYGDASFTIPVKSYKFRVDYDGTQYWSDVINVIANEETDVELPLEQLALDTTNNPNQKRFDGTPPEFAPKKIVVASLGSITGLLTQSIVAQTEGEKLYYFINDHLGTPQKIIDENNSVVWAADYKPFGKADVTINTLENNFRFPGQYYDADTGLHYNWHRYYDPKIGRYLRADPIGLDGGNNLYLYVKNNPLILIDPSGERGIFYGKYCGPGTDLGNMSQPIDAVDAACKTHDLCYRAHNVKWHKPRSKQCHKRDCDRAFYHELDRLLKSSGLSDEAKSYAKKARWHFKSSLEEPSEWEKNAVHKIFIHNEKSRC